MKRPDAITFPYRAARIALAEEIKAGASVPMMLFPIGNWHSKNYPNLPLSLDLADQVIANFEAKVQDRDVPVEASGRHDTAEPAVGWVKRVYLADCKSERFTGQALWCDWEPNNRGAMLLNEGAYRYNSVEIDEVVDQRNAKVTPSVLLSVCLTNVPVVRIMPPLDEASAALRLAEHCDGSCGKKFNTYAFEDEPAVDHNCGKRPFAEFTLGELVDSYNEPDDNNNPKKQAGDTSKIAGGLLADTNTDPHSRSNPDTGQQAAQTPTDAPAFSDLMAHASAVHAALVGKAAGKKGVGALRTQAKELCDKFAELCDDTPALQASEVHPDPAAGGSRSAAVSQQGTTAVKASEGTASEREHSQKVVNHMTIATKLKLAETASEAEIEAAIDALHTDRDTAVTELAEAKKTTHDEDVKVRLAEALNKGEITAAEAKTLAEKDDVYRDSFLEARKGVEKLKLSEQGGSEHRETGKAHVEMPEGDPSQQVSALTKIKMAERKDLKRPEAQKIVLSENPELHQDYLEWRRHK
jgi:hypothetical protein